MLPEPKLELNPRKNKEYKVEAIRDSTVYTNKVARD